METCQSHTDLPGDLATLVEASREKIARSWALLESLDRGDLSGFAAERPDAVDLEEGCDGLLRPRP